MSFFKKKDEDRKEAYEPSDDNVSAKEGSSGGKGGGEPAAPSVDPSTKAGKSAINKSMDDGRFGYGYIDRNTGVEVPWYIDMINGGGANAAGDTFVSPFAELPFGGGMASMPTNLANAAGIAPYGYNQPRRYAQAGMQGYPTAAPAPRLTGGGSPAVTPEPISAPTQDFSNLSSAPAIRSGLVGYNPQVTAGTPPYVNPDMSGISSAPAIRSGLVGYNPQVVAYNAGYTAAPTQGVTDEVYLPAGTQTGSSLSSQTMAQAQRARDYMNYRNAGGKSSYEEWNAGIYR